MKKYWLCCALFMTSFVCNAQLRKVPQEFEKWLDSKGMRHATVALEITELADDAQPLYFYDNERSVHPASVMKLLTTASALMLLDPNKTVPTEVYMRGEVSDGVLKGDVVIRGYGDAMLASSRSRCSRESFANGVALTLRKEGVRIVEGNIIGDGTILKQNPVPGEWTWEDMGNYYAPSISGLNYGDNMYEIVLDTSRRGHKPSVVKIEPSVDGLTIDNQLMDIDYAFDSAYVFGAPYQNERTLLGAVPHNKPQFSIKGDVPDPAQFASSRIRAKLLALGININGKAVSARRGANIDYEQARLIYTHKSESISFIVKQTNIFSVNLFAEMLLRQIALEYGDGTETAGIAKVTEHLRTLGIDTEGLRMYDGCGLAPTDCVTAHLIVELLKKMKDNDAFVCSLPVAGKTGTVNSFLKGTRLEGKARIKSGTLNSVISYSGYIDGSDGKTYAVSIIVNNYGCVSSAVRKNIEKMLLLLIP